MSQPLSRPMAQPLFRVVLGALVLPSLAVAQGTSATSAEPSARPAITRADLAAAYIRLDRVISAKVLNDTARANVSRAFDKSTLSFFGGKFLAAITTIDSLTVALSGAPLVAPVPSPARLVNGRAPSIARDQLLARLATLDSTGPLAQAVVSARARAALLVDVPSAERSAEFLSEPAALARDVTREVAALANGKNPYASRAGDLWRSYRGANGVLVPFRVVATATVARSAKPVPVLIVLHGAGGDENMFIDAYGAGITPKLAAERGVLLVSPATTPFGASPENFDGLLAVLKAEYRIDASRVYVLGHSMGSGVVARLTQQRPNVIAATVCLAGGSAVTVTGAPPMLFVGAELDPLIPAKNVQAAAVATPTAIYRLIMHEGHTLMVANGVRAALPWLLEQHR